MAEMIDIMALKAALLQLAKEDPPFFQDLLRLLPKAEEKMTEGVSEEEITHLVRKNFDRFDEMFKKLA